MGARRTSYAQRDERGFAGDAARRASAAARSSSTLDAGTRADLVGLALAVFGVVLFVAVVAPGDAPVSAAISAGLHRGLGLGAYIFPFAFVGWGAFFFLKPSGTRALRLVLGLLVIIIAVMGLLSLWQPGVLDGSPQTLFADEVLVGGGGYAGSSVAWLFMSPFGRAIATIVLVAGVVAGLVLAGLSISIVFLFVKNFFVLGREERRIRREKASFTPGASRGDGDPGFQAGFSAGGEGPARDIDLAAAQECRPVGDETLLFGNERKKKGGILRQKDTLLFDLDARPGTPEEDGPQALEVPGGEVAGSRVRARTVAGKRVLLSLGDADVQEAQGLEDAQTPRKPRRRARKRADELESRHMAGRTVNLETGSALRPEPDAADGADAGGAGTQTAPDAAGADAPDSTGAQRTAAAVATAHRDASETDMSSPSPAESVKKAARPKTAQVKAAIASAAAADAAHALPPADLLKVSGKRRSSSPAELQGVADELQQTLEDFGVPACVVGWTAGPTVTVFKIELPRGTRMSTLVNLADDIALSLAASGVRIAQIPRTSLVGVEIPNRTRETVYLGDVIGQADDSPLSMAIGEDTDGNKICLDLAKMPHLLVAGTTGSGKSVALNGMIMTMLMRTTPEQVRMIMVDPKRVEFKPYEGIPHLYVPPVTDPKEAAGALKWAVAEMERRLKVFEQVGARNIAGYNKMVAAGKLDDEDGDRPDEVSYIVLIIDELTDLMMVAGKEVEDSIVRISQLARAVGIHLIIATQSPKSSVVTGMIKANITNRMACTVATNVESRVIIDQSGAEKLTGNGDMLFVRPEWGKPKRIQGVYVSEAEIEAAVEHLKAQGEVEYHTDILKTSLGSSAGGSGGDGASGAGSEHDPLLWQAAEAVVNAGLGSTSMLQRRLKVGYSRAGRIMDELEEVGVVGPAQGSKARDVLIETAEDLEAVKIFDEQDREG